MNSVKRSEGSDNTRVMYQSMVDVPGEVGKCVFELDNSVASQSKEPDVQRHLTMINRAAFLSPL